MNENILFCKEVNRLEVRVYIGGKRVKDEELKNYEIKNKKVKKILSDKLTKKA